MIIFSCLKKEFDLYVKEGIISNKVYDAYKEKLGKKTKLNQIKAWANSLPMMSFILQNLPDNVGISIEFNIPLTSKRIDFVVSGYSFNHEPILLLFELKQWEVINDVTSEDAIIKTIISNKEKTSLHPSYQVMCYAELLLNYNKYIEENHVHVIPIVYLHNYSFQNSDPLLLNKFKKYYTNAPIYGCNDKYMLRAIVNHYIKFGDDLNLIKQIDKSEVKPNKKLLDAN